jgi:amidophosphoribosyltransferase
MCGLFGVINSDTASYDIFTGLQQLQHRGQDGAGICVQNNTLPGAPLTTQVGLGLLHHIFSPHDLAKLHGSAGIGHTRYATVGGNTIDYLQPFVSQDGRIALAHNGNIVNTHEVAETIQENTPEALKTDSDSELILHLLNQALPQEDIHAEDVLSAIQSVSKDVVGAMAIVGLIKDVGLFAFRSPLGLRPLILGQQQDAETGQNSYAITSESIALTATGFDVVNNIEPGEMILIEYSGKITRQFYTQNRPTHCLFEWVYFARVESELDNLSVYDARFQLGKQLAKQIQARGILPDVVIPVPETSRIAAIALAEALGVPCREGLIKNRYSNRTFILDSDKARQSALKLKLFPIPDEIRGKKVLVVDDSIVRGNTAKKIIQLVRDTGAAEIYLASTCPPITHPCFFGIDFPSQAELPASRMNEAELQEWLNVDALVYQSLEGLKTSLQHKNLCDACLTGHYPLDTSSARQFAEYREADRQNSEKPLAASKS